MSVQVWPYRRPQGRIEAGPWHLEDLGGDLLPTAVSAWDYATDLSLARLVRIDLAGLREDTGLNADAPLRLCVRYWPSTSRLRYRAFSAVLPPLGADTTSIVEISAIGADLGGVLTVETLVELAEDTRTVEPFVPNRAGSILWNDQTRVHLEGAAGLLPIAPVSFREADLPLGAAWYVSMDGADWAQAAMGSLLVLLNTDNAAVKRALEAQGEETSLLLWDTLKIDIVTDLVGRALDDEAFDDGPDDTDPDGSLTMAGLVRSLVRSHLAQPNEHPSDAMKRLREERRGDHSRFRSHVQMGVGYPGEAGR